MSELKAYRPRELVMQGRHNEPIYLKSEADKVISSHKYKRCIELADSCALRAVVAKMENRRFPTPKNSWRMVLYPKWYKRWHELAEKFKPNSTAHQGLPDAYNVARIQGRDMDNGLLQDC